MALGRTLPWPGSVVHAVADSFKSSHSYLLYVGLHEGYADHDLEPNRAQNGMLRL